MTYCIDEVWVLFKKHISDHDVRLAFAKELIVDSQYENLYGNPFCSALMEFLADYDDEYFLVLHSMDDDCTVEETVKNLKFQMDKNGLSTERRDRLMNLWMETTGNYDPETRISLLKKEKEALEKRIQDIDEAIGDWKK